MIAAVLVLVFLYPLILGLLVGDFGNIFVAAIVCLLHAFPHAFLILAYKLKDIPTPTLIAGLAILLAIETWADIKIWAMLKTQATAGVGFFFSSLYMFGAAMIVIIASKVIQRLRRAMK